MYKCDFHIHTIPTRRDASFDFSSARFKEYVSESKLECVAITNHNIFDRTQYEELLKDNPEITFYPGIEINAHTGHLLIIANPKKIDEFETKIVEYNILNDDLESFVHAQEILSKFSNDDYLIIPHYDKKDQLSKHELSKYGNIVIAGEVSNSAKFYRMKNNPDERLTAWLSSDYRVTNDGYVNINNCTYVDAGSTDFEKIRDAIKWKRVYLDREMRDLLSDDNLLFKYHPNLNVVIGGRSTGKTHLLSKIFEKSNKRDTKYIRQFSLLEKDGQSEEDRQRQFEDKLKRDFTYQVDKHKSSFSELVTNIMQIDVEELEDNFTSYCESIIKFAQDSFAHNIFAKHPIFSTAKFETVKTNYLETLIKSASNLFFDTSYKEIFNQYLVDSELENYLRALCCIIVETKKENEIIGYTNEVISEIKKDFTKLSNITPIEEYSAIEHFENKSKVRKFEETCQYYVKEKTIFRKTIGNKFQAVGRKGIPTTSEDIRNLNGRTQGKYKEGADLLVNGKYYDFVQWCKENDKIQDSDIYKMFVTTKFELLNEYGLAVSGGERAEYNLLKELDDAEQSNLLLIDEPESSFDNIFLNKFFNEEIRRLSTKMPVIVATHNSTIGASLNPNFYIYTERLIDNNTPLFNLYYGKSGSQVFEKDDGSTAKSYDLILQRLEAGEEEYKNRSRYYEKFNV